MAIAGLGILGLLNVLAGCAPVHQRLDLTANKQFSLSDQSIQLAQQLPAPVKATGFFVSVDRSQQENAESLLKQYQTAGGGKLTYEFVDPEQRPAQAQALGVRQSGTVVFQMGDQRQNATAVDEQDFTDALLKLENPTARKAYLTTGHGARDTNSVENGGNNHALQLLPHEDLQVDQLTLLTAQKVP